MFSDISEALLTIEKRADQFVKGKLHLVLSTCVCRHESLNLSDLLSVRLYGWSRVRRLCAILLRRRQAGEIAKTPRPCQPIQRSAGLAAPGGDYGLIDAKIARGFAFGYPEAGFPT
jgi:hypothetical protein